MYEFKLDFILDRDAEGKITGFTVIAQKQGEAEFFCKDFGLAFSVNKANFFLAGFSQLGLSFPACKSCFSSQTESLRGAGKILSRWRSIYDSSAIASRHHWF